MPSICRVIYLDLSLLGRHVGIRNDDVVGEGNVADDVGRVEVVLA
jgi:hypothetical protein